MWTHLYFRKRNTSHILGNLLTLFQKTFYILWQIPMRMAKHLNRFPRQAVPSFSLEIFKITWTQSWVTYSRLSCLMTFSGPFSLSNFVSLWFCDGIQFQTVFTAHILSHSLTCIWKIMFSIYAPLMILHYVKFLFNLFNCKYLTEILSSLLVTYEDNLFLDYVFLLSLTEY